MVDELALLQPRHGLKAHMRMRRDIHGSAFGEGERPEPIEKAPWPDQPPASHGQRALDSNGPDADLANRVGLELFANSTKGVAGFSGDVGHRRPQRSRRSSTSDTMNPNPGQPPDWTDRSNHLRACALSPRTRYQLPRP